MDNSTQIIELEYRFLIPVESLSIIPPKNIEGFKLENQDEFILEDSLFERENITLKSENIGFRIRKVDSKIEFTYKKFLGREKGFVKYDEFTVPVTDELLSEFKKNYYDTDKFPILKRLQEKGDLYFLLTINNKRNIYRYVHDKSIIELMIEDINYESGDNKAKDSMIEVEFKIVKEDKLKVENFVNKIKAFFKCVDLNEGKNSRAAKLLNLTLK